MRLSEEDSPPGPTARKRIRHSSKGARKTGAFRTMQIENEAHSNDADRKRGPIRTTRPEQTPSRFTGKPPEQALPRFAGKSPEQTLPRFTSKPFVQALPRFAERPPNRASYALGAGGHCRVNCSQKRPFTPSPSRKRPSAVASSCPAKLMLSAAMRHSPSASRTASTS